MDDKLVTAFTKDKNEECTMQNKTYFSSLWLDQKSALVRTNATNMEKFRPIDKKIVNLMRGLSNLGTNLGSHVLVVKFHGANFVQPVRSFGYSSHGTVIKKVS